MTDADRLRQAIRFARNDTATAICRAIKDEFGLDKARDGWQDGWQWRGVLLAEAVMEVAEADDEGFTPWNCPDCGGLGSLHGCRTCTPKAGGRR